MLDVKTLSLEGLKTSRRLICQEIISRGWQAWLYYDNGLIRIKRADGKELEIFSATPPTTSSPAAIKANNKYLASLNFINHDLPVPETYLVASVYEAKAKAAPMLESGRKVVIKPLSAAHGHGVTTGIGSPEYMQAAVHAAAEYSEEYLVQEYLENFIDLRLTCINYKYVAGLIRIPARVKGDGCHTVKQLIEIENKKPSRGEDYAKPLNVIDLKKAAAFLDEKINQVPAAEEYVTVLGTANVGAGGETIDITNDLPDWFIKLIEKAAKASDLPVCGVDFLVAINPDRAASFDDLNPKLIEINVCPALFLHETPTFGQARPVIKQYVDYLATI